MHVSPHPLPIPTLTSPPSQMNPAEIRASSALSSFSSLHETQWLISTKRQSSFAEGMSAIALKEIHRNVHSVVSRHWIATHIDDMFPGAAEETSRECVTGVASRHVGALKA